jgi:hypothetical protein
MTYNKSRLRPKGQVTLHPEQAWFWSEWWQQMECEAEVDLANGRVTEHADLSSAINILDTQAKETDAED